MLIEEGKDYVLPSGVEPPYRSIKNLGYGNSGTVDKVEDINTGIVYARKTIRLHAGRRKAERRRIFDNEAKIIRDLATHHHIIRVFATYYDDPDVCLIMHPVADSGDLETFLQGVQDEIEECSVDSERRPDEIKVSTLERAFGCLANGLAFMHQQRIRHKDIKSKNILVHQGNVVYTDFGISGNFSQADSSTTEGPAMGLTRRYSAPEVIEQEPRNSSSDVYSLGCVFIEILSALTASFTVDFRTPYCDDMERLRTAIESCKLSGTREDLARLAITMTLEEKNQRPTSFQVWTKLRGRQGYSCAQCVSQYLLEGVQLTSVGVADGELVNWEWDETRVVFKVLWPELFGNANNPTTTSTSGLLRDKFFKIRRFVVIREGDNSCTFLSIQTYRKRGVIENRTKSHHAIVYTGPVPPPPLEYEIPSHPNELPTELPIRVLSRKPQYKLHSMSRVNFSKLYTVKHNATVAKLGYVDPNDLSIFISQFEKTF